MKAAHTYSGRTSAIAADCAIFEGSDTVCSAKESITRTALDPRETTMEIWLKVHSEEHYLVHLSGPATTVNCVSYKKSDVSPALELSKSASSN